MCGHSSRERETVRGYQGARQAAVEAVCGGECFARKRRRADAASFCKPWRALHAPASQDARRALGGEITAYDGPPESVPRQIY